VAAEVTTTTTLTPLDRQRVVSYVESCQTPDGGYFFARVPPASGQDTYHAVKCLALMGRKPLGLSALKDWLTEAADTSIARNLRGLYFLSEVHRELQMSAEPLLKGVDSVRALQNAYGGFGTADRVYVEVPSELEATYCAVATLQNLDIPVDAQRLASFVQRLQNTDGGFGAEGRSSLASTYYALATLARLGQPADNPLATLAWLHQREEGADDVQYLEHLFWLTRGLEALGEGVRHPEKAAAFTLGCQRPGGGFGRAHWGIATLEDTQQAVAILKSVGYLGDQT
jgi:hypothetical protein